jgi:uncharacterized membrane protein
MRRLLPILLLFWMAGCVAEAGDAASESSPGTNPPRTSDHEPQTAVYRCTTSKGDIRLVTRTRENGMHVFLPPDLDEVYLDCEYDRRASIWEHAKLSGVDFRATGNEPGWVLEIREGDRLELSYDYGQGRMSAAITGREPDPATRTTRITAAAGDHLIEVLLTAGTCRDTMADETFPTRVEVAFDDRRLTGCGRPLH